MAASRRSAALLFVLVGACASGSKGGTDIDAAPAATRVVGKQNPNVISRDELLDPVVYGMDALRAIRQLRPAFFRTSGPQSFANADAGTVHLSQDYGPLQELSQLVSYNTTMIYEVRYLGINEAANRFGLNANGGPVIVVLSNKQP